MTIRTCSETDQRKAIFDPEGSLPVCKAIAAEALFSSIKLPRCNGCPNQERIIESLQGLLPNIPIYEAQSIIQYINPWFRDEQIDFKTAFEYFIDIPEIAPLLGYTRGKKLSIEDRQDVALEKFQESLKKKSRIVDITSIDLTSLEKEQVVALEEHPLLFFSMVSISEEDYITQKSFNDLSRNALSISNYYRGICAKNEGKNTIPFQNWRDIYMKQKMETGNRIAAEDYLERHIIMKYAGDNRIISNLTRGLGEWFEGTNHAF